MPLLLSLLPGPKSIALLFFGLGDLKKVYFIFPIVLFFPLSFIVTPWVVQIPGSVLGNQEMCVLYRTRTEDHMNCTHS